MNPLMGRAPSERHVDDTSNKDGKCLTRQATMSGKYVRVLFDFDWTIVNENSDVFIFKKLASDIFSQLSQLREKFQWTDMMHHCVGLLHERKVTPEQIEHCFDDIPLAPEMSQALRLIASRGVSMEVVSDANSVFIDCILRHYRLRDLFSRVTTNPAFFDSEGRLHIVRLIKKTEPHGCVLCPENMCKGAIVTAIITAGREQERVFYVGDGGNDLCPALRLRQGDYVFARSGYELARRLTLPENLKQVKAIVHLWTTYADLLKLFQEHLANQA